MQPQPEETKKIEDNQDEENVLLAPEPEQKAKEQPDPESDNKERPITPPMQVTEPVAITPPVVVQDCGPEYMERLLNDKMPFVIRKRSFMQYLSRVSSI